MKLEEAIKSNKFSNEVHKSTINVLYTAYWLKNTFSVLLKNEGLTLEQFNVMRILKGMHPEQMNVKEIGSRIIEKSSNVPRIIDKLVVKKLAKRTNSKVDKRETLVTLTDKGINILKNASIVIDKATEEIKVLTEPEAMLLNGLLEKMREKTPESAAAENQEFS